MPKEKKLNLISLKHHLYVIRLVDFQCIYRILDAAVASFVIEKSLNGWSKFFFFLVGYAEKRPWWPV